MSDVDLSDAGVRDLLIALAAAGVAVYRYDTDGDTFIDLALTPETHVVQTMLSWRDGGPWELRDYTVGEPEPVAVYRLTAPPSDLRSVTAEVAELDVRPDTDGGAR